MLSKRTIYLIHGLFWLLIILTSLTYPDEASSIGISWNQNIWPLVAGQILIFYSNTNWLLPGKFRSKQYLSYGIALAILLISVSLLMGHLVTLFLPADPTYSVESEQFLFSRTAIVFTKRSLIDNVVIVMVSAAYTYFMIWQKNEKERAQLTEENLKSELSFLSAQLDPHFLFNTLNTLYSLALKDEKSNTHKGIQQLIGFINQMTSKPGEVYTTLAEELDKIKNYIDLQKLRFSPDDDIEIELVDRLTNPETKITARVLIPLVENAFKHGISLSKPSFIHIEMKQDDTQFCFRVINTDFSKTHNEKSTGLGLRNISERLRLMYRDHFTLKSGRDQGLFKVSLNIRTSDVS